jgi:hypothetical protein
MLALFLTLVLQADPALQRALDAAVAVPGARVELLSWKGPSCRGPFEVAAIDSSGRVPVRVRGAGCDDWGWATVKLVADAPTLTSPVRTGDSLTGRWVMKSVEVRRGATLLTNVDATATATRTMKAGQVLTSDTVRVGPPPGTPVTVRVLAGGIALEQQGTIIGCATVCASLPTGRRVSGRFEDGVLIVGMTAEGGRL